MAERETQQTWPAVTFETLPWHRDLDEIRMLSRTARQRISSTYQAAVPPHIASASPHIPLELSRWIEEVTAQLARFDGEQIARGYGLPTLLLRSESSASSQIENLTSSARNVALAEVVDDAPHNARLVAGNIAAMKRALDVSGELSVEAIVSVWRSLMGVDEPSSPRDGIRDEQVWIGGTAFSPHGAKFVPPAAERISEYMDDLIAFSEREDLGPIVKAALFHAQFETIHPFVDGNGRTGRTLLHNMLRGEGVLQQAILPVSAGLLHDVDAYLGAISAYQQGNPLAVIEQVLQALEVAVAIGRHVAREIDEVLQFWDARMSERAGSSIRRLPELLIEQPVVTRGYLAEHLGITPRAVANLIDRACEYGMLRPIGNRRRGECYQSDDMIRVLDEMSSIRGIRRMASGR